jgi:hypothetical protein
VHCAYPRGPSGYQGRCPISRRSHPTAERECAGEGWNFPAPQDSEAREWRRVGADAAAGVIAGAVSLSKGDRQETRDSGGGCNERQCQVAVARGDRGRRGEGRRPGGELRGGGEVLRADEREGREKRERRGGGEDERRRGGGRRAGEGEGESLLGKSPRTQEVEEGYWQPHEPITKRGGL